LFPKIEDAYSQFPLSVFNIAQTKGVGSEMISSPSTQDQSFPSSPHKAAALNWWLCRESQPALSFPNQARLNDAPPPSKPKSAARKRTAKA
jgi:hypothetical protein